MPLREPAGKFQRAIAAALDDEEDFVAPAHRAEVLAQRPNARLKAVNLVIGGNDDRYKWLAAVGHFGFPRYA